LFWPSIIRVSLETTQEFIRKYISDARLEAVITDIWRFLGSPPSRLSAFYFLIVFRGYYYNPTSYIKGGFAKLFAVMLDEIRAQGGEIRFNTKVNKINTRGSCVQGVSTDKGEDFFAHTVISNVNAIDTLAQMLDNEALKDRYAKLLSSFEKSPSAVQVYLGLKAPAKNLGMRNFLYSINEAYDHDENFKYCLGADYQRRPIEIVDHCQLDAGLAPETKGTLTIMTLDTYAHWGDLSEEEYRRKKQEVAQIFILRAEKYLPHLRENIEFVEVATPRTMQHFSGSPEGAIYGFSQIPAQAGIQRLNQKTRIRGLYLAGAWTQPGGGVHGCFISAVDAAGLALKYLKNN
jgi:prolycopene isomerase